jgi:phosphopantetheinyl transferase (holo-ACP synthase)
LPVGNDVVDIRHPLCQPDAIHPRFDIRVFSSRENALLATSTLVHLTRWTLWAAKESAFKACRKLDGQVRFFPRDFEVHLSGEWAEVTHRLGHFDVWLDRTDDWVHALTSQTGEKPDFRIDGDSSADPGGEKRHSSEWVRRLAQSALGAFLDLSPSEVEIFSTDRIPLAQRKGVPLPFDLSLSHDGRFVSCAWESIRSSPAP